MPTPIENNTTALQALKVKAEGLPDKTPEVIDYSEDLKGLIERTITEIKWPEGITSIGSNAFYGCTNLVLTSLPEGITSIGSNAFRVTKLNKLWISKNCTTISAPTASSSPFMNCSAYFTDLYTDAPSKPSGWGRYFYYTETDEQATVHYNVTKAEFETLL